MSNTHNPQRRRFAKQIIAGSVAAGLVIPALGDPTSKGKRALRIVHLTDMHLDARPVAVANVTNVLQEINRLDPKPDLIINTGDSVFRSDGRTYDDARAQWDLLSKTLLEHNRIPMKSCIGNHDVWFGPDVKADDPYRDHKLFHKNWVLEVLDLPSRYYSTTRKGWHFIALD